MREICENFFYLMYFRIYIYKFNNQNSLELNSIFKQPLKENEVRNATKSAETVFKNQSKDYKYKNETLINLLEITDKEQKEMKTIISKEEYKRRYENTKRKNIIVKKLKKSIEIA